VSVSRVRGFQIQGVDSACVCFSRSSCSLSSCQRCVCVCVARKTYTGIMLESPRGLSESL